VRRKILDNNIHTLPPRRVRLNGLLLIATGLLLAALGLALLAYILDYITLADILPGTYRDPDAGPAETPTGAYIFVGFTLLFGLTALSEGAWRVWFGRHNRYLLRIILVLGGIFFAAGMIAQGLS
jgi:hypothetical protein